MALLLNELKTHHLPTERIAIARALLRSPKVLLLDEVCFLLCFVAAFVDIYLRLLPRSIPIRNVSSKTR